eukprot:CAMPEP_0204173874 /NCGR_PEP_ID=MMETSP0361-20130328/45383_1 /ASSEMBLY_ACC=CAM_ASM_000343 /TAXON_ID=268821 /ORGANISM="Scrippsiella Hangoei, Strain SHTV-5" /LENGTH=41 /DNA_ID= /DNA_START= /DNA_END= /DNA_ORIENTATION=
MSLMEAAEIADIKGSDHKPSFAIDHAMLEKSCEHKDVNRIT